MLGIWKQNQLLQFRASVISPCLGSCLPCLTRYAKTAVRREIVLGVVTRAFKFRLHKIKQWKRTPAQGFCMELLHPPLLIEPQ